jgi:D-beta-D-heptose 7-phosphate kinase/D-beta-D-heptose 1-phosphate adenosyltransferase
LSGQLHAAGIKQDIQSLPNFPTITKLRVISRQQQLIRLDFEEQLIEVESNVLLDKAKKHLPNCNLMILSDYNKGTLSCSKELIALAKSFGVMVLVDPKGKDLAQYTGADIITPNLKEFEAIVGVCKNEHEISTKARKLINEFAINAILLTRGERGMTLIRKDEDDVHLPAHAREVFDVTGAGDTVIAVLGAALAAGATYKNAMQIANLAASLVVSKLGAATVSVPELKVALSGVAEIAGGVLNEEQLIAAVSEAKLRGKQIVFTNGCFDILHAGHVIYLQQAKQLGDYLIVAVNDDASVKRLKGESRPINSIEQRMAVLAGLGVVDWVCSFADGTPERLLKILQPDILVKGGDYSVDGVVGADIVRAYGGEVRVLGVIKNVSTTAIINKITEQ